MVTARASHARLALTGDGLLLAVDAADSIKARNSLERMKAHQLAVLHRLGMKFAGKAESLLSQVDLGISGNRPAHGRKPHPWRPLGAPPSLSVHSEATTMGCSRSTASGAVASRPSPWFTRTSQSVRAAKPSSLAAWGTGAPRAKEPGRPQEWPMNPHVSRHPGRGWLKHGGRPGNPDNAPRCGARTRSGPPCKGPAMANGRCRSHGGPSTGRAPPRAWSAAAKRDGSMGGTASRP